MINIEQYIVVTDESKVSIYLQIADGIAELIAKGILPPGVRIIPTRELSSRLKVHRRTVVKALDELLEQGLLVSKPRKGIFVAPRSVEASSTTHTHKSFSVNVNFALRFPMEETLVRKVGARQFQFAFNDGFPDVRLAPFDLLIREYSSLAKRKLSRKLLSYSAKEGSPNLRRALAENLRQTRGMPITADNIVITKGAQMAIYLAASMLLKPGDNVVVAGPNYFLVNHLFHRLGAKLHFVEGDDHGMKVGQVEALCRKIPVRLIYVIPHHHHPTTVTLSMERRLHLLSLADRYKIAVIEDDYDFDVFYEKEPVLPLSSIDRNGNVIYIGTLSKIIAPSIRIGYMVAPVEFNKLMAQHRFVIDMQGDNMLEEALAALYQSGAIARHLKKIRKLYRERRDFVSEYLQRELAAHVSFTLPIGGMSIWTKYHGVQASDVSAIAARKSLFLCDGTKHNYRNKQVNAFSLGFASMGVQELEQCLSVFASAVKRTALRRSSR
jgi:GntR family transcriptional regulator / MocR family aminotransferase